MHILRNWLDVNTPVSGSGCVRVSGGLHLLMLFACHFARYNVSLNADELFMYIIWLKFGHIKGAIK